MILIKPYSIHIHFPIYFGVFFYYRSKIIWAYAWNVIYPLVWHGHILWHFYSNNISRFQDWLPRQSLGIKLQNTIKTLKHQSVKTRDGPWVLTYVNSTHTFARDVVKDTNLLQTTRWLVELTITYSIPGREFLFRDSNA